MGLEEMDGAKARYQRADEASEAADEDDGPLRGGRGLNAEEGAGDEEHQAKEQTSAKRGRSAEWRHRTVRSLGYLHAWPHEC